MSKRDDFHKTMEENLALWGARLETIKTKQRIAATPTPGVEDEEQKKIAEWQARSDDAIAKLAVLKNTQGDDWDGLKAELVKRWEELDGFIGEAEQALHTSTHAPKGAAPATAPPVNAPAPVVSSKPA
jgi:hypothetical protein